MGQPAREQQFADDSQDNDDSGPRMNGCALAVLLGTGLWVLIILAIWLVWNW